MVEAYVMFVNGYSVLDLWNGLIDEMRDISRHTPTARSPCVQVGRGKGPAGGDLGHRGLEDGRSDTPPYTETGARRAHSPCRTHPTRQHFVLLCGLGGGGVALK